MVFCCLCFFNWIDCQAASIVLTSGSRHRWIVGDELVSPMLTYPSIGSGSFRSVAAVVLFFGALFHSSINFVNGSVLLR
jgi:hypothetical protein